MSVRTSHRRAAVAAPIVAAGLILGACGGGDDDGAESRPTIELDTETTNYQTIPPATTVPETDTTEADAATTTSQTYTVQAGDFPLGVADKFGVSLEDIANLNDWAACSFNGCPEFPGPGAEIQIPGGVPVVESTDPSTDTGDAATTDTGETGVAIEEPGDNCGPGKHTVVAGDIPIRLAELYDVTLDDLNAANANNAAYGRFVPGDEIIIPAKPDCAE